MLDFDLAEMYGVETKALKQAVRRSMSRFPEDFAFELNVAEFQRVVTICDHPLKFSYITPFAFTEQGVAMLSSVLKSDTAIQINISIMRAFVVARHLVLDMPVDRVSELEKQLQELRLYLEDVFTGYNDINEDTRMQLELISQSLAELQAHKRIAEKPRRRIGFNVSSEENTEGR
jgi:hypothetical protein